MTVSFQLEGQEFVAFYGGPQFKFTEAISLVVNCETQEEVDYYWESLSAGAQEVQCGGWLKDAARNKKDRHRRLAASVRATATR